MIVGFAVVVNGFMSIALKIGLVGTELQVTFGL